MSVPVSRHGAALRFPARVAVEGPVPWQLVADLAEVLGRWGDLEIDVDGPLMVLVLRRHRTPNQAGGGDGERVEGDAEGEDSCGPAALRLDQLGDGAHSHDVGDASSEPPANHQEGEGPQPGPSPAPPEPAVTDSEFHDRRRAAAAEAI